MADHLTTPTTHRLLTSPFGVLFATRPFEYLKTRSLPTEFGVQRARVAADLTLGSGPEAFLEEVDTPPAPDLHDHVADALARYADRREAHEAILDRWTAVFWDGEAATEAERVALERERRVAAERRLKPTRLFRFLASDHLLPPVKFDVPAPDEARARWASDLTNPTRFYAAPDRLPSVDRSVTVRGPETVEYLVRFESPSPYVGDTASARVYEPTHTSANLPTLVFHGGLGMLNDQLQYWPEEEYLGRTLAPDGYRVVLPDAPWHGRRERPGWYSGEPYLARPPVGFFELYAAAAAETGVLVDWARSQGAPAVGVGGVSLGGITTLHVAGHCDTWPASMRPDLAFPVAPPGALDTTLVESELTNLLGVTDALATAGWTPADLQAFAPLLNPPSTPGLDPDRVFSFGGLSDTIAPYHTLRTLLRSWDVPRSNVTELESGHFGVLTTLIREDTFQALVRARLDAVARRHTDTHSSAA